MSYKQFLSSTANRQNQSTTPSPVPSTHRNSPANYTSSLRSISSVHSSVTQSTPTYSTNSPITSSPLSSFPPTKTPAPTTNPAYRLKVVNPSPSDAQDTRTEPSTDIALKSITQKEIDAALQACLTLQNVAVSQHDKRPFAALLLGPDNTSILTTHFSISHFQHAESELARLVGIQYSTKYLAGCTLVSTWEPCAMCSGTMYWAGIGRLLYAAPESKLLDLTGDGNDENMTMSLPCRTVLHAGQRKTEIIGPVQGWEEKVVEESGRWWKEHQKPNDAEEKSIKENGSIISSQGIVPTYVDPDNSGLGSIGEDGEYQADLKIDWMP